MDDDFDSPFFLMRAMAPAMAIGVVMLATTVLAPVVLYLVARWRAHKEPSLDPQLGVKFALHYFAIAAFQRPM